jgi:non-reducing end alpha-L-arabinofuranosidase
MLGCTASTLPHEASVGGGAGLDGTTRGGSSFGGEVGTPPLGGAAGGPTAGGTSQLGGDSFGGAGPDGGRAGTGTGGATTIGNFGGAEAAGGGPVPVGGAPSNGGRSGGGGLSGDGGASAGGHRNGSAGTSGPGGAGAGVGGAPAAAGPCDVYASGETPCFAAHSTVRALYSQYAGSLYQVRRASDSTTQDIAVLAPGGAANATSQDVFCAGTTCVITVIYDQSGHGNHLEYQGQGSSVGGDDKPASATSESVTVGGEQVYSLYINPSNSYWRDGHTTGVPLGSAPESLYMVTSGTHVNSGCCFDYGNSETDRKADGAGAMDAIYFGTSCWFGGCSGSGPWVQGDLEYGLFPGGASTWNSKQVAFTSKFVTALLKNNGTTMFALKGGNAQSGNLTTLWDGALPNGYDPMKKQGAIVLGSGGDCCASNTNQSLGTFYEGAMVAGYPSDAIDNAIQSNVVAAGYQ